MTKKNRTALFLSLLILFLLVGPLTIFFCQGYRLDFKNKKVVQTGGLYLKISPKESEIYINNKLKKKTNFLTGSTFIKNLLPKKYKIEIKKEGYYPWSKELEIKEKQVTDAKNIILFPKKINFRTLSSTQKKIENFFISPDKKQIICLYSNSDNLKTNWNLELLNIKEDTKTKLLSKKDFRSEARFLDLQWSPDSKKILIKIEYKGKLKNFILELNKEKQLIPLKLSSDSFEKIFFSPNPGEIFLIKKQGKSNALFLYNYLNLNQKIVLNDLICCKIFNKNIIWLKKDGFLYKSDLSGKILEAINLKPLSIKQNSEYKLIFKNLSKIFLKENNTLYYLDQKSKQFKEIFKHLQFLKFSPDVRKVVLTNHNEIWLFFLESQYEQPQEKIQNKVFLTRFSEKIDQIFWLNNYYLIFKIKASSLHQNSNNSKIKIIETDARDRINIVNFPIFNLKENKEITKIFFSQIQKKLYILASKNLYISDLLLP